MSDSSEMEKIEGDESDDVVVPDIIIDEIDRYIDLVHQRRRRSTI